MTLITPFTAFAPHSVAPGPRMTSMRSISPSGMSCTSQKTPAKSGEYDRPAVDQHQQLVGRLVVESAGSDRPLPGADTCHLQPWGKTKRFGQAGGSRAANVVLGDDEDGGGRLGNRLGLAAGGGDLDAGELVEIETGEAAGWGSAERLGVAHSAARNTTAVAPSG